MQSKEAFSDLESQYNLRFIARASGDYFVPIVKPFPSRETAEAFLVEVRKSYPGAFTNETTSLARTKPLKTKIKETLIQKPKAKKVYLAKKTPRKVTPYKIREKVNVNFSDLEIKDFIKLKIVENKTAIKNIEIIFIERSNFDVKIFDFK